MLAEIDDTTLQSAMKEKRLLVVGTGSNSPCLDLTRISKELRDVTMNADLVILEGMGRSVLASFVDRL